MGVGRRLRARLHLVTRYCLLHGGFPSPVRMEQMPNQTRELHRFHSVSQGGREKAAEEPIGSEWLTSSTSNVALVLTTRPAPENDSPPTAVLFTRFSHPGKTRGLDRPGAATLAAISWLSASTDKLIYYNGYQWHVVLLPGGTRAVWPSRLDGRPAPGAATRYYRGPAR